MYIRSVSSPIVQTLHQHNSKPSTTTNNTTQHKVHHTLQSISTHLPPAPKKQPQCLPSLASPSWPSPPSSPVPPSPLPQTSPAASPTGKSSRQTTVTLTSNSQSQAPVSISALTQFPRGRSRSTSSRRRRVPAAETPTAGTLVSIRHAWAALPLLS